MQHGRGQGVSIFPALYQVPFNKKKMHNELKWSHKIFIFLGKTGIAKWQRQYYGSFVKQCPLQKKLKEYISTIIMSYWLTSKWSVQLHICSHGRCVASRHAKSRSGNLTNQQQNSTTVHDREINETTSVWLQMADLSFRLYIMAILDQQMRRFVQHNPITNLPRKTLYGDRA